MPPDMLAIDTMCASEARGVGGGGAGGAGGSAAQARAHYFLPYILPP